MKTTTFGLFWKISGEIKVFQIADHDSDVGITKFKMADSIWRPFIMKTTTFCLFWKISGDIRVFGIADHDSYVRITKFKMADPIWRPFL